MTNGAQLLGDHVLLDRVSARMCAAALREMERLAGVPLTASAGTLLGVLAAVGSGGTAEAGSAEVPAGGADALFGLVDPIPISEVARMLSTSRRNATDLCLRGSLRSARKLGGRWLVERADVQGRAA